MSYGSTFAPFEANGRLSSRPYRAAFRNSDVSSKVYRYDQEFDVNLSRVEAQAPDKSSIKASMVAYSKKMRSLQDARNSNGNSQGDPLFVRAKHIPKYPTRPPKKRRPMSFDELLGRDRDSTSVRPNGARQRPQSDRTKPIKDSEKKSSGKSDLHLPLLTERHKKSPNVQVSFVSASDLYEIVDFSLKSKGTRTDSLQMLRLEKELEGDPGGTFRSPRYPNDPLSKPLVPYDAYDKYERTSDLPDLSDSDFKIPEYEDPVPSESFYQQTFSMSRPPDSIPVETKEDYIRREFKLPAINTSPFKKRPTRAKRMKLYDSELGDIPEDNVVETGSKLDHSDNVRVTSPPPKQSPRNIDIASKRSLDAIQEASERINSIEAVSRVNGVVERHGPLNESAAGRYNSRSEEMKPEFTYKESGYRAVPPFMQEQKSTKKILIRDDGDVRIEVTQCPPKHETVNSQKLKAQKRFKKLIFLRDAPR